MFDSVKVVIGYVSSPSLPYSQKALASRLKDLEMFSAGVAQQIVRQQEKLHRAQLHLEKGDFLPTQHFNLNMTS